MGQSFHLIYPKEYLNIKNANCKNILYSIYVSTNLVCNIPVSMVTTHVYRGNVVLFSSYIFVERAPRLRYWHCPTGSGISFKACKACREYVYIHNSVMSIQLNISKDIQPALISISKLRSADKKGNT